MWILRTTTTARLQPQAQQTSNSMRPIQWLPRLKLQPQHTLHNLRSLMLLLHRPSHAPWLLLLLWDIQLHELLQPLGQPSSPILVNKLLVSVVIGSQNPILLQLRLQWRLSPWSPPTRSRPHPCRTMATAWHHQPNGPRKLSFTTG